MYKNILYISIYSPDCVKISPITGVFDRPLPFPRLKNKLRGTGGMIIAEQGWRIVPKLSLCPQIPLGLPQKWTLRSTWAVSDLAPSPQHDWTRTSMNVLRYLGFLLLKILVSTSHPRYISSRITENHCEDVMCGFYFGQLQLLAFSQPSESAVAKFQLVLIQTWSSKHPTVFWDLVVLHWRQLISLFFSAVRSFLVSLGEVSEYQLTCPRVFHDHLTTFYCFMFSMLF